VGGSREGGVLDCVASLRRCLYTGVGCECGRWCLHCGVVHILLTMRVVCRVACIDGVSVQGRRQSVRLLSCASMTEMSFCCLLCVGGVAATDPGPVRSVGNSTVLVVRVQGVSATPPLYQYHYWYLVFVCQVQRPTLAQHVTWVPPQVLHHRFPYPLWAKTQQSQ